MGSIRSTFDKISDDPDVTDDSLARIGAFILGMYMDEDSIAYHSVPNNWQRDWGYNDAFDDIFDAGGSIKVGKLFFEYNDEKHLLWSCRGDYWNLGAGAEVGMYKYNANAGINDNEHYDAITYELPMSISLYGTSNTGTLKSYANWYPDQNQWWITAFNYRYPDPISAKDLSVLYTLDLSNNSNMYNEIKLAILNNTQKGTSYETLKYNEEVEVEKRLMPYAMFDDDSKTIWLTWQ